MQKKREKEKCVLNAVHPTSTDGKKCFVVFRVAKTVTKAVKTNVSNTALVLWALTLTRGPWSVLKTPSVRSERIAVHRSI